MRNADPEAPRVSRAAVLRCQLHEWYPILRAVTLKTKMIHLDGDFVDYLLADGLVLPEGCEPPKVKVAPGQYEYSSDDWSDEEDGEDDEEGGEGAKSAKPRFDQLVGEMRKAIEELGGSVFPKLNWSSPRDAIWINAGENCKCMSPGEVIMLIKSSDFIVHDLCHAFDCCEDESIVSDLWLPPRGHNPKKFHTHMQVNMRIHVDVHIRVCTSCLPLGSLSYL